MTVTQPGLGKALRNRFVDAPGSVAETFRSRRWELLRDSFPALGDMHVIDLGGTPGAWLRAPVRPAKVTVLGFEAVGAEGHPEVDWIDAHHADACALPDHLAALRGDLVYSNAVLEHVGGADRRRAFADSVHRLADRHWVQTPYRYFPVEPHWLFPGFQFLPVSTRVAIGRRWRLVHSPDPDYDATMRAVLSVELIGRAEMRHLFPRSRVLGERFAGMTKSLIAIKDVPT